jgi:curved DNA-binding protein CbpA
MDTKGIKNHYATLGVSPKASRREILKARNRLLHQWHPDINREHPAEAKEKTLEILLAAEILLNDNTRAEYDRIYRNHFQTYKKRKADKTEGNAASSPEAWPKQSDEFIVCPSCGRKNMRSKRNYCLFCGEGIGENAKPFSWDSVNIDILAFEEQNRESILSRLISPIDIFIILAVVACIVADAISKTIKWGAAIAIAFLIAGLFYMKIRFRN